MLGYNLRLFNKSFELTQGTWLIKHESNLKEQITLENPTACFTFFFFAPATDCLSRNMTPAGKRRCLEDTRVTETRKFRWENNVWD